MSAGKIARLGAAVALAVGAAAGVPALAGQAQASVRTSLAHASLQCTTEHEQDIFYNGSTIPPEVIAENEYVCGQIHVESPATIYKYESGSWVEVASGSGFAYYYCNGSTDNKYEDQAGQVITAPCV
jgi:hypothetical protein